MARVTFYDHPTNDAWCRDHGPIFVKNDRTGEVALTDWRYNAWGDKYPPYDLDNEIPPTHRAEAEAAPFRERHGARRRIDRRERRGPAAHERSSACSTRIAIPHLTREQIEQNLARLSRRENDSLGRRWDPRRRHGRTHRRHHALLSSRTDSSPCVERNRRDPNHRILRGESRAAARLSHAARERSSRS